MNVSNVLLTCFSQYGDVFTMVLFGRRVTVALGAKGNNFILGGKSTAFSAEDAYTVGPQGALSAYTLLIIRLST
jgi:hypothetical protein